jgi:hypothetical protein
MKRNQTIRLMSYSFIILLLILIMVGCTALSQSASIENEYRAGGIPEWYRSGSIDGYPTQEYLIGTGEGLSLEDAIATAQATIAGQLKVSVDSTIESFRKETNSDGTINFFETFSESSSITISETIKGSQIIKQEEVDGTYYVFAALHIQRFLSQLLLELGEIQLEIINQISQARIAAQQGLVLVAVDHYTSAYNQLVTYYTKRAYVEALAPNHVPARIQSAQEVVSEIRALLGAIQLYVISGENQQAAVGSELPEPVVFQVRYSSPTGQEIPVSRIPVTLRAADQSSLGRHTTDSQGMVSITAQALPTTEQSGTLRATMDMFAFMGPLSSAIGRPEVTVHYAIAQPTEDQVITLALYDVGGNRMQNLERAVTRELEKIGVTVTTDSDWRMTGACHIISEQQIPSYQGTQYLATIEFEIKLNNPHGIAEKRVSISSGGRSMLNEQDALRAACDRLRIDTKTLASLIAELP